MTTVSLTALQETVTAALAAFPRERGRIERAAALIALDAVTIGMDAARVASQTGDGTSYLVTDAGCECLDSRRHPGQSCKHRWAVDLVLVAGERQRRLDARASEQARRAAWSADSVAIAHARRIGWAA